MWHPADKAKTKDHITTQFLYKVRERNRERMTYTVLFMKQKAVKVVHKEYYMLLSSMAMSENLQ